MVYSSCRRRNREKELELHLRLCLSPYFFVRFDYSRGAKYCQNQWQYDHWKARDPKRGATRHKHDSSELRWKSADKNRASQTFHLWAGEYGRYLDPLTTIDISFVATWKQRSRYEKQPCTGRQRRPASGVLREEGTIFRSSSQTCNSSM